MKKTNILVLRWRLWRVCKKLKIKPYKWQKDYALGKSDYLAGGRRSGKTTAIMLWALIRKVKTIWRVENCAYRDPDTTSLHIEKWWIDEYGRMARKVGLVKENRTKFRRRNGHGK